MVTSALCGVSEIGSELLSLQGSRQANKSRKEAVSRDCYYSRQLGKHVP